MSSLRPGFISVTSTKIALTEAVNVAIEALAIAVLATCGLAASRTDVHAQSIEPRSYSNAPVGVNFLIGGYAYSDLPDFLAARGRRGSGRADGGGVMTVTLQLANQSASSAVRT